MTVVGLTQRVYRGFAWWTGAQWLGFAVAALRLAGESHWPIRLLAELAMLGWPLLVLQGARQFYAREPVRGSFEVDISLFALAAATLVATYGVSPVAWHWYLAFSALSVLMYGYVAWLMWALPERQRSRPLAILAVVFMLSAASRLPRMVELASAGTETAAAWLAAQAPWGVLMFLMTTVVVLTLSLVVTYERTERELRDSHHRLRLLANVDMLTDVPNRRHLQEVAEELLSQARVPAALMLFDIDHFKRINDEHGHAVGDQALRLVAQAASGALRSHDLLGRLGGDEFVALLPETTVERALRGAQRITEKIHAAVVQANLPLLTISVGVVEAMPNESLSSVLLRADRALYEAKRQGRGRAVLARGDSDMPVFIDSRRLGFPDSG